MPPEELDELDEELLDELEVDELVDDDDELELLELEVLVFVQLVACGLLPVTVMLSILAKPALLVASKRILFQPAFNETVTLPESLHVVHEPVPLKLTADICVDPLTITCPLRFVVEPFA